MADRKHQGAAVPQKTASLDLAHLERQTMGDERLERDVLALFAEQAAAMREGIAEGDAAERRRLAHRLAGSARAIGAFRLAGGAAELEAAPLSEAAATRLFELIEEVMGLIRERMR